MYISPYCRSALEQPNFMKFGILGHLTDIITCVKFLVNRFRGYGVLTSRKWPFPIDLLRALTTVRTAVLHCHGEFRPHREPKLLNRLRWNLAWVIASVTPPHMHKTKSVCKGGRLMKCSTQACFFGFFGFLNGPPAYPVRIGWALSVPKNVFWW